MPLITHSVSDITYMRVMVIIAMTFVRKFYTETVCHTFQWDGYSQDFRRKVDKLEKDGTCSKRYFPVQVRSVKIVPTEHNFRIFCPDETRKVKELTIP